MILTQLRMRTLIRDQVACGQRAGIQGIQGVTRGVFNIQGIQGVYRGYTAGIQVGASVYTGGIQQVYRWYTGLKKHTACGVYRWVYRVYSQPSALCTG